MTKTEREELLALEWAGMPEVPQEATDGTPVWIYAIARVLTYTSRESWAIVRMDYGRTPAVVKTFSDGGVARILSIHPYKFLDDRFVPKMENAAATKNFIAAAYGVPPDSVARLKKPDLLRLFYMHCIKDQLAYEEKQASKI